MATDILAALLLNICLADYSIRDETINDVIKSLNLVTSKLESLSSLAIKQPEVLHLTISCLIYYLFSFVTFRSF